MFLPQVALASTLVKTNQTAADPLLLVATALLRAGFGLTVPALNTYTPGRHGLPARF